MASQYGGRSKMKLDLGARDAQSRSQRENSRSEAAVEDDQKEPRQRAFPLTAAKAEGTRSIGQANETLRG